MRKSGQYKKPWKISIQVSLKLLAQWNMGCREWKLFCHWMKLCQTAWNPLSNMTKNWVFVLPVFVQEAESFWPFKLSLSMVWIAGWVFGMSAPAVNATYQVFDRHLCCLIFVYILFWIWYCTRDSTLHFFSLFMVNWQVWCFSWGK